MAFYSPSWVRKLVKEDAQQIVDYVSKSEGGKYVNDFRDYIDATLPFALWLDMGEIRQKVLDPSRPLMKDALKSIFNDKQITAAVDNLYYVLEQAYITVINSYIENPKYEKITAQELENRLNNLTGAEVGFVKRAIKSNFSKSVVITNVSKRNQSVMLLTPTFNTVKFGKHFREALDFSSFGGDLDYLDSPSRQVKDLLFSAGGQISGKKQDFFRQLQNVGHIEVDVISTSSSEIKRGQSSPRLLQALISVPNNPGVLNKVQRQFSKETLQSESRVIVRKKFSNSKMVFEMLVEHGMSVGIPETQAFNLVKASKEQAFATGRGLTAEIRKNPSLLFDLETSKSIKKYTFENLKELLQTGKSIPEYNKETKFVEKAVGSINKVKLKLPNKTSSNTQSTKPSRIPANTADKVNLASLQTLLNLHLQDVISANMGDGDRKDILNYRTGRFASSVEVKKMSQSREGMITAFYSYMKNPYATFSDGGRQSRPKSRDPKLLIGKSIREIGATVVANRMRAVLA